MHLSARVGACLLLIVLLADAHSAASSRKQVRVLLVGDSTMARTTGYGDALCRRFDATVICENRARGGRSSKSYRAEGLWDDVMTRLHAPEVRKTYVLIEFGHNDQHSTTLPEFSANLRRYVEEVRDAGAIPVLVTPLTRRAFKQGKLVDGLAPWADATTRVARTMHIALLDLHADSVRAVVALGAEKSLALAEIAAPENVIFAARSGTTIEGPRVSPRSGTPGDHVPAFDYTHLGMQGAALFADIAAREIRERVGELGRHLHPASGSVFD